MSQKTTYQLWSTLIKYNISPNQIYYLDCIRTRIKPTVIIESTVESAECQRKGYLNADGKITDRGLQVLEEFDTYLVKRKAKVAADVLGPDYLQNVEFYRNQFPAQRLPSGLYARQSVEELKKKFIWFFQNYPQFTWQQVFDAADYYTFLKRQQDTPYMYMMTSSYFISKTDPYTKEVKSALADTCQEMLENPNLN